MYIIRVAFILRDAESSILTKTHTWDAPADITSEELNEQVYEWAIATFPNAFLITPVIMDATESVVL